MPYDIVPPTFAGLAIFGASVEMQAGVINPLAFQQNEYPGLSGIEELNQGLRGAFTTVKGRLWGVDGLALNAAEWLFRSFYDGRAYPLTDQFGVLWMNVKLENFQPQGRIQRYPTGECSRQYEARFRHMNVGTIEGTSGGP